MIFDRNNQFLIHWSSLSPLLKLKERNGDKFNTVVLFCFVFNREHNFLTYSPCLLNALLLQKVSRTTKYNCLQMIEETSEAGLLYIGWIIRMANKDISIRYFGVQL